MIDLQKTINAELIKALKRNDIVLIKYCIKNNADVNQVFNKKSNLTILEYVKNFSCEEIQQLFTEE